jgi:hypothetical protein
MNRSENVHEFRRINMHGTKTGPDADPGYAEKYHPGTGSRDRFTKSGGNKIVDDDGNPKTVYHASWVERDFEKNKKENTAIFFADKARTSEFGTVIHEANIYMANPLDARWGGVSEYDADAILAVMPDKDLSAIVSERKGLGLWDDPSGNPELPNFASNDYEVLRDWMVGDSDFGGGSANWYNYAEMRKAIRNAGFDGVMGNDPFGGSTEYIVFDVGQIRIFRIRNEPR